MEFIREPLAKFIKLESSSSIVLFAATVSALILANSPVGAQFLDFWNNYITISIPGLELSKPVIKWINDGLMVIFFFLIGLEIKRELIAGEINSFKKASLPMFAAIGGMIFPALLFTILNNGKPGAEGWGIPIAADIAFTLGIMQLLGNRVPVGLKVFLMAFAIIDDLGAVLVIAFFYSNNLAWEYLGFALLLVAMLALLSWRGMYSKYFFFIISIIVWVLFLKSGIHATIAGVLLALTIPLKRKTKTTSFYTQAKEALELFVNDCKKQKEPAVLLTHNQLTAIEEIQDISEKTAPPLQYLEHSLHGWVSYLIMPLFAFANAGVAFSFSGDTNFGLSINIALSMIIGNFLGIFLFSYLAIKLKISEMPANVTMKMLAGISILGGLGFTMSLFINNLAFTDQALIDSAKIGILIGSVITGTVGFIVLRATLKGAKNSGIS
ncbi:MAG: Na+/H+ antiporter NhaA [Draconibacterium sp.]